MIFGFAILLLCQLLGEVAVRGFGLPLPGPVLGIVILVVGLHVRQRRRTPAPDDIETNAVGLVADGLLRHLALLFVPAGVGIIGQTDILKTQGMAIGAALVVSTALTLLVTVLVFVGVKRWLQPTEGETR